MDHLETEDDEGDWGQFLTAEGEPRWERVVLAGGSQGGKVATYLSRDKAVARAIFFSAAGVAYRDGTEVLTAPWSQQPRATPAERTWGVWHEQEAANEYAPVLLESYGVRGPIIDIEAEAPPYQCSHMLRTNLLPSTGSYDDAHRSMGADDSLALDAEGLPALAPAWIYMLDFEEE